MQTHLTFGRNARRTEALLLQLEQRSSVATAQLEPAVRRILSSIRREGDRALRRYARKLDGLGAQAPLRVSREEMAEAWSATPKELRASMQIAAKNIRRFAQWQMPKNWTRRAASGLMLGQRALPLDSVGCYVPGGR